MPRKFSIDICHTPAALYSTDRIGKIYARGNCCESEGEDITYGETLAEVYDAIDQLEEYAEELAKESLENNYE